MSDNNYALAWDQTGDRLYETGIDHGVLYHFNKTTKTYDNGYAWNGLTGVTEKPSGAEPTAIWADNIKYLTLMSKEELGLTIEAFTYPEEFAKCDGSDSLVNGVTIGQQSRDLFGMSYRTNVGNDVEFADYGYKLHLVYGCLASPSERAYATINDSPEAQTFSWEVTTNPVDVAGKNPTAIVTIDSSKLDAAGLEKLHQLETILYGTPAGDGVQEVAPRLPLPSEIAQLFSGTAEGTNTEGTNT